MNDHLHSVIDGAYVVFVEFGRETQTRKIPEGKNGRVLSDPLAGGGVHREYRSIERCTHNGLVHFGAGGLKVQFGAIQLQAGCTY